MQKNKFKKIISNLYLIILLFGLFFPFNQNFVHANSSLQISASNTNLKIQQPTTPTVNTDTTYTPLAPLPGLSTDGCKDKDGKECIDTQINKDNPCPFGNYLNIMIKLIIGIAGVLAMVMIIYGGIEYMTSEIVSEKASGKDTISNAVLGLLIALGSFLILNTVNPKLLEVCLNNLPEAEIKISLGGESNQPFKSIDKNTLKNTFNINCNESGGKAAVPGIAKEFIGKTLYSKENRNTTTSSKIYVDCSSFASQVYVCAGLQKPGNISTDIFSTGNFREVDGTTYDFTKLNPGDLIGWKPGENKEKDGHVMIYLGNGQMIDTQGGEGRTDPSKSTRIRNLDDKLKKRIKYVKWP